MGVYYMAVACTLVAALGATLVTGQARLSGCQSICRSSVSVTTELTLCGILQACTSLGRAGLLHSRRNSQGGSPQPQHTFALQHHERHNTP